MFCRNMKSEIWFALNNNRYHGVEPILIFYEFFGLPERLNSTKT